MRSAGETGRGWSPPIINILVEVVVVVVVEVEVVVVVVVVVGPPLAPGRRQHPPTGGSEAPSGGCRGTRVRIWSRIWSRVRSRVRSRIRSKVRTGVLDLG